MNSIIVSGRLTKDGDIIEKENIKVWKGGIAVQREYKEKGDVDYKTDFFDLTAFGNTADYFKRNGKKGDMVIVQGRLYFDEYTTKDGVAKKNVYIKVDNANILSKANNGNNINAAPTIDKSELEPIQPDFVDDLDETDIPF